MTHCKLMTSKSRKTPLKRSKAAAVVGLQKALELVQLMPIGRVIIDSLVQYLRILDSWKSCCRGFVNHDDLCVHLCSIADWAGKRYLSQCAYSQSQPSRRSIVQRVAGKRLGPVGRWGAGRSQPSLCRDPFNPLMRTYLLGRECSSRS